MRHSCFDFYFRSELIGCMSFSMKTLLKTTSCTTVRKSIKFKCEKVMFFEVIYSINIVSGVKQVIAVFFSIFFRLHQNINGIVYYQNQ